MLALWLAEQPLKLYQLTSCVYWKGRVQFSHNISQIVKDFVSMFWPLPIVIESKMYNRHFQSEFNRHHLIRVLFAVIWEISFDICWVLNSDSEEGLSVYIMKQSPCLNALCFHQILSRKVITAFFPLSLQLHTA